MKLHLRQPTDTERQQSVLMLQVAERALNCGASAVETVLAHTGYAESEAAPSATVEMALLA